MTEARRIDAQVDAVVVGAGFAGMYALIRLRRLGLSLQAFETGQDVGGTWYWNRYPGARCDIESMEYSYSFDDTLQQEWHWPERYSAQPEILKYANHVASRYDLRRSVRFNTRVLRVAWQAEAGRWHVETDDGRVTEARFVVMATGCLSAPRVPDIVGAETFAGETLHTGQWPHEPVDFSGKRVGVIGTGSSGIQVITALAGQARQLYVFQRTPHFTLPSRNRALDPEVERRIKADSRARLRRLA